MGTPVERVQEVVVELKRETPVGPILGTSRKCTQAGWVSEVCVGACTHILQ
jgi:hypothetical protein